MARKPSHHRLPTAAPAPTPARRPAVILKDPNRPTARFAEVAGGTAAGCAAICCCCPCGILNLLVLTVFRLPAGLCRKALRKQRMKRRVSGGSKKAGLLGPRAAGEKEDGGMRLGAMVTASEAARMLAAEGWPARPSVEERPARPSAVESEEMERRMWAEFYGAGFWRSPSQREEERTKDLIRENSQLDALRDKYNVKVCQVEHIAQEKTKK